MQDLGINVLFQGRNFIRLLNGLWITIEISFLSVILSMSLGIIMGMIMTIKNPVIKIITRVYLEFVRIMPQLVLLFLMYFGITRAFQINLSGEVAAIIVFTLWGTAEMGDLVRGALESIPKHQYESGKAIGLTNIQIFMYVIMPQTIRRLVPQAINLVTRMIKTTSLIALINVVEVVKVGQQIIEASRLTVPSAALWIYGTIFFMYFIVCYPISRLAARLEKAWKN
ncbi:amino acid ABC transporter permease [Anaerocolumna cellulosilytica]|uniref:Amino acid ABC transporter permease n=1 Tax=Anaerocolumna cellulosilytica TaxID=433286 RepID=A0A6S6QRQ8_9FIRM|nr:amino acid ABC transporter permease [Anaerocolumna cellulosilytica]MBB5197225.1 polar amino acid transport system permease protein [Anaerocolumna cellulosilytica]BCJ94033.1 amino acid ABC transporter permease [Anaerocolumna cellulosilytica]